MTISPSNRKVDTESRNHDLVPRLPKQGYAPQHVETRRKWIEDRTDTELELISKCSIPTEQMRGNIENAIGSVQMPLGIAGPLEIIGLHARGIFYVPLATTEGALVRSYERGMLAITRAGGATARIVNSENSTSPIFTCPDVAMAMDLFTFIQQNYSHIKAQSDATTHHGRLRRVTPRVLGRDVVVEFGFDTADAHGMNMLAKATEAAGKWIADQFPVEHWYVMSGASSEKRVTTGLLHGGKGQYITAGIELPARISKLYLHASPDQIVDLWRRTMIAQSFSGIAGYNGHYANGLAAFFIATGQDVANVANSAVGLTHFEQTAEGGLYVSVTLPSVTLATVGGGTHLGTAAECLNMLGCLGSGKVKRLAEIVAATLLAGELSFAAALASGEFVNAHEQYGRNRPSAE